MDIYAIPASDTPEQSRSCAKQLLGKGTNRFHLAVGFMICVSSCTALYVLLSFVFTLLTGFVFTELDERIYDFCDLCVILLSFVFSIPLFHGYKIMCADTLKKGVADLMSLFVPFSSGSCFFTSLFLGFLSFLSCLVPLLGIALGLLSSDTWLIHTAVVLFTPLWIFLMSPVRRMCRVHECFPSLGFRGCVRLSRGIVKTDRHRYSGLLFSYIPSMLLSLVTLFIYGIYAGFALKNLACLDYTLKNICKSSEKKEY